ncbi:Ppx/GppA phosphatase family protein [Paenibacillus sp. ATY16]|uniref:Ppx/GppA phosphatase family protein n=1 Tax=Paenibacillus sp. ATY16 TaxID=1759312 RepID=UPI002010B0F7|nr:Ppx/GppA phosphatase family protein [Paenibacillus sp. ATY16]MCK9861520.1 Ppx/GppA family phosphatase [Paenibacillus sp. ATY16]
MTEQRIGIIDIGSNSVRLVVYERTANGAHRVIDGGKRPARLAERVDDNGILATDAITELLGTLNHFTMICAHNRTGHIRAVATAAIRNAANQAEILETIKSETGLTIELLSGEEEASYGFLGMINAMDVQDGFLVDIGGGSTEVSLFRGRQLVQSVSFPFGCVSLNRKYAVKGTLNEEGLKSIEALVSEAVKNEPWLTKSPSLPLIGVGGTARAMGKTHQAATKYPFTQTHNYPMTGPDADALFQELYLTPLDRRKKFPGLSKDRADVIVPGIAVLRTLFRLLKTSHYRICGSGLRDGLFHATRFPGRSLHQDVLAFSLQNVSALHPAAPKQHVMQVNRLALQLYDELRPVHLLPNRAKVLLDAASTLFRIGASIDYYEYAKHTFYLIVNSHLNGLAHREILMIAAIASYKSKNRTRQQLLEYKELLGESDYDSIHKLGILLQLAAALDRSETQAIGRLEAVQSGSQLLLNPVRSEGTLAVEAREVEELSSDFKKLWGLTPVLALPDYT